MVYTCDISGSYHFATRPWARIDNTCNKCYDKNGNYYGSVQLDERRKIEILKHAHNKSRITKKQKYSMVARRNGVKQVSCPQKEYLGLTTACDVPGKPMFLRLDRSIPLTRFKTYN